MNWFKKIFSYNKEIGYLNRYLKKGFDPWDYTYLIPDFLESIGQDFYEEMKEKKQLNENNLFNEKDIYNDDEEFYIERWINNATPQDVKQFEEFVSKQNLDNSDRDAPPTASMEYQKFIKPTWLVHFTNDPYSISLNGFTQGWPDWAGLAYTTFYDKKKREPGYNFAFDTDDTKYIRNVAYDKKYGKHAVLFYGSGIKVYHYGDEENQIIIYGPSVNINYIIPIIKQENQKWGIINDRYQKEELPMFESEDINQVISWGIDNIDMIKRVMKKNDYKEKPKKYIKNK